MKLEVIIRRVELARKSKTLASTPYENCFKKMLDAAELVDFVERPSTSVTIKQEARKYFIVTVTSSMEIYFKRVAELVIDEGWMNIEFAEILKQQTVSLNEVLEIKKKNLSLGEIVSISYPLQDLDSINKFFSKLTGVKDFLAKASEAKITPTKGKSYTLKQTFPRFRDHIDELLRLRHLIVHHEGFKGILGLKRMQTLGHCVASVVSASDAYFASKYSSRD